MLELQWDLNFLLVKEANYSQSTNLPETQVYWDNLEFACWLNIGTYEIDRAGAYVWLIY